MVSFALYFLNDRLLNFFRRTFLHFRYFDCRLFVLIFFSQFLTFYLPGEHESGSGARSEQDIRFVTSLGGGDVAVEELEEVSITELLLL